MIQLENDMPRIHAQSVPRQYAVFAMDDSTRAIAYACTLSHIKQTRWGKQVEEVYGWENFDFMAKYKEQQIYALRALPVDSRSDTEEIPRLDVQKEMRCIMRVMPKFGTTTQDIHIRVTEVFLRRDCVCAWINGEEVCESDDDS